MCYFPYLFNFQQYRNQISFSFLITMTGKRWGARDRW